MKKYFFAAMLFFTAAMTALQAASLPHSGSSAKGRSAAKKTAPAANASRMLPVEIESPLDHTMQPARILKATGDKKRPLVVALHTWSFSVNGNAAGFEKLCIKHNFNLIYPHFRGPNWTPQALGSDLAVSDIVAAVEYGKKYMNADEKRIYLIGGSGGGHMALLMAGRHPELWAGVSAWCPITDIAAWHASCKAKNLNYYKHIEKACGNPPGNAEMMKRSPVTYLARAKNVPVNIGTGIHDGIVPISHALNAYNILAEEKDRIPEKLIRYVTENGCLPEGTQLPLQDPAYQKIYIRRTSGNVSVTIFEGGHNMFYGVGIAWLAKQRKGQPAVWNFKSSQDKMTELSK